MQIKRCVNIDWLEVYALEGTIGYPHDADWFRRAGYSVQEREYGTPLYKEMFTIYGTDGLPLIEIRRNPKSVNRFGQKGILDPYGCHIRLCNRTCYMEDAAGIMQQFLERNYYEYSRISRIDICLDFERFDSGDLPQIFLDRYVKRKYSKINQADISLHGLDNWDGRYWNSCRWGSKNSMINTKLYDKTLELKQQKDKPYIRQAWFTAGLIDDWFECKRYDKNGKLYTPSIWRLEFSIKSSEKNWFVIEDLSGKRKRLRSIRHTLDNYHTRSQLLDVFFSLTEHYFHFKYVEYINESKRVVSNSLSAVVINREHSLASSYDDKKLQRKDRCRDKVLFHPKEISVHYKLAHVASSEVSKKTFERLLTLLYAYREQSSSPEIFNACNVLIAELDKRRMTSDNLHWSKDEWELLRRILAKRIKDKSNTLQQDYDEIRTMLLNEEIVWDEIK